MVDLKLLDILTIFPIMGKYIMLITKVFSDLAPFMILQMNFWLLFSIFTFILDERVNKDLDGHLLFEGIPQFARHILNTYMNGLSGGGYSPLYLYD